MIGPCSQAAIDALKAAQWSQRNKPPSPNLIEGVARVWEHAERLKQQVWRVGWFSDPARNTVELQAVRLEAIELAAAVLRFVNDTCDGGGKPA